LLNLESLICDLDLTVGVLFDICHEKRTLRRTVVSPIDLIDEVRAALEVAYVVIDAEFANQPIGHEAASVLWGIIVKLRPLCESLNGLRGAA
jgi:hypothetical protein